jgi:hypothetical protein
VSDDSQSQIIAATFFELRQFCRDVALLLNTGEQIFLRREWSSAQPDKTCLYTGSYSLSNPDLWLPLRFFRCYTNPTYRNILTYVAVVIDLPFGREMEKGVALLTAGVLSHDGNFVTPSGRRTCLFEWHLYRNDRVDLGKPSRHDRPFEWTKERLPKDWPQLTSGISGALTTATRRDGISKVQELESVVEPMLNEIRTSDG